MTRRFMVGAFAGALAAGLSLAPASAHNDGGWQGAGKKWNHNATALKFTPQVRTALADAGFTVEAVAPATQWNSLMFSFPAERASKYVVTHTGGLEFVRNGTTTTLSDFVVDLNTRTVDVTVSGVGPVQDALTVQYVRYNKRLIKASITVTADQAQALNSLFGVELFSGGQNIGRLITKLGHNGWDCWTPTFGRWHHGRWDDDRGRWDKWDKWFYRYAGQRFGR